MTSSLSSVLGIQATPTPYPQHVAKPSHADADPQVQKDDPATAVAKIAGDTSTPNTSLLTDPNDPSGGNGGYMTTSEQQAALAQGATQMMPQNIDLMA